MNTVGRRQFKLLPIEWIKAGRYQIRENFAQESLKGLALSISEQGIIEPLVVRELAKEHFEIIAGERRWRAAMKAQLHSLPCIIVEYTDEQAAAATLIENIQREELNPIEEAQGYRRLLTEFYFSQENIAKRVGKSRPHVANILRLLTLSYSVQQDIKEGKLSAGHAKMLVGLSERQQLDLAKQIQTQGWSVRHLEKKIKLLKQQEKSCSNHYRDRDIVRLEGKISEQVGAPVTILTHEGDGGVLQIKFFNNDTLAGLLERLGLRYD